MKTAILITNYNKSRYLTKCIKSCLDQTERVDEIHVFDDGSNDKSIDILIEFKKKIKLHLNKKKKYNFPARNQLNAILYLFQKTKCELIFLLDADDFFYKTKVKKIKNFFAQNKKIFFLQNKCNHKKKFKYLRSWPDFYPTSTIVFKKEFFVKFLKKNKNILTYKYMEIDAMLSIFAYFNKQYNVYPQYLSYYRTNLTGINSFTKKFSFRWWNKRNEVFNFIKKNKTTYKNINNFDYLLTLLMVKILKCLKL